MHRHELSNEQGKGKPITFILTPGQQHEATAFEALLSQGAVRRAGAGRPKLRPGRVVGDKGYSHRSLRARARGRGIGVTIPRREDQGRTGPFDRSIYRTCNRIERLINRCKQFRRIATRYEKKAENYMAMWTIAATLLWL